MADRERAAISSLLPVLMAARNSQVWIIYALISIMSRFAQICGSARSLRLASSLSVMLSIVCRSDTRS
jgi:hypothetical protein